MTDLASSPAERIGELATAYMASKQLFAAARTGMFGYLHDAWRTPSEIALALGVEERVARMLADSMSGLGLLERDAGRYRNGPVADAHLAGAGDEVDLRPWLVFLDQISWDQWDHFPRSVDTAEPGPLHLEGERFATMARGTGAFRRLHATMLSRHVDLTPFRSMLDLDGMDADFAIEAMRVNPGLRVTCAYLPEFAGSVRAALETAGVASRAEVVAVDPLEATPSADHDLALITHSIHRHDAEANIRLLRIARDAVEAGGRLMLMDFFLDDDPAQRVLDANHAAEYLVFDGTVIYPVADVRAWLVTTDWRPTGMVTLPGGPRVLLAEAV